MAKLLKLRGGTTSEHGSFTGAVREVTVDTDKDTLVVHDGSTAGGFTMMRSDIMQEALDVNGQAIVSSSNGNISLTPNGSGTVQLDGITYPTADGTNGQVLQTNGSGVLSFGTVDISVKANIASPTFTGTPAVPTASANTNSTQIASTAFVQQEINQIIVFEAVSNPDPVAGDFTNGAIFVGQF